MAESYMTLNELAAKLRMSRSTIDAWRKQGLPYLKMGRSIRFEEDQVMAWIKENKSK